MSVECACAEFGKKTARTPCGSARGQKQLLFRDRVHTSGEDHADERSHTQRLERDGGSSVTPRALEPDDRVCAGARSRHLHQLMGHVPATAPAVRYIVE